MRIDPTKVPHLRKTDTESPVPDGLRRGLVPKQRSFSVQDVRDYSTPQGAAMANEEMRRLVENIETLSNEVKSQQADPGNNNLPATQTVTPSVGTPTDNDTTIDKQFYTVYHNGNPVNTKLINRAIDFRDSNSIIGRMREVVFSLNAINDGDYEIARIRGYVDSEPWYIERFTLEVLDTNAAQDLTHNGYKYRSPMYHDVIHGLNNPVYSIYCVGSEHAMPEIELLSDRLRVRCRVSDNYDIPEPFLNTTWNFSADVSENISKFDNLEFIIIVKGTFDERAYTN